MSEENTHRLNLFDFFGFPNRQQRDETLQICDINKLHLFTVEDPNLWLFDTYFAKEL